VHTSRNNFDVLSVPKQTAKKPFRNRAAADITCADKEDAFHNSESASERNPNLKLNWSKSISLRNVPARLRGEFKVALSARLSLCQRERIKVRVCFGAAPATQTRSLVERCRVPGEFDDSQIAVQQFSYEQAIPTAFDREFGPHDSYAHHRPVRSRALRPHNRNRGRKGPPDAGDEIFSL
jgi:hypothetical protein